jgi:hypothetical protein
MGFLALAWPCRRLGLVRKSLIETGRNFKSLFQTVQFKAGEQPDYGDYGDPLQDFPKRNVIR